MAEFFLHPDGEDSPGRGSVGSPYQSVEYAVTQEGPGQVYTALPGVYPRQYFPPAGAGTPTILRASEKHKAILSSYGGIDPGPNPVRNYQDGLQIGPELDETLAADYYLTVDGFQCCFNDRDGIRAYGNHLLIKNVWSHHNGRWGVQPANNAAGQGFGCYFPFVDGAYEDCLAEYNGGTDYDHGFYVSGNELALRRCISCRNVGIGVQASGRVTLDTVLAYRNGTWGFHLSSWNNEWVRTSHTILNCGVYKNKMGIALIWPTGEGSPVAPPRLQNNVISDNSEYALAIGGLFPTGVADVNYNLWNPGVGAGEMMGAAWAGNQNIAGANPWRKPDGGDFTVEPGSLAVARGNIVYRANQDLYGNKRFDDPPDLGPVPKFREVLGMLSVVWRERL